MTTDRVTKFILGAIALALWSFLIVTVARPDEPEDYSGELSEIQSELSTVNATLEEVQSELNSIRNTPMPGPAACKPASCARLEARGRVGCDDAAGRRTAVLTPIRR